MLDELVTPRTVGPRPAGPAPRGSARAADDRWSDAGPARPRSRTSFAAPDVPAFAVERDRLVSLLDPGVQRRLTIVVAPPGYGKTVLLSQWAAAQPRRRVRWLTLEPGDNDVGQFARHLRAALGSSTAPSDQTTSPPLDMGDEENLPAFVARLLADLGRSPPTTVMLDDFHVLSNPALVDAFGTLVEHAPPWIHVVLATRVDPPLRSHRFRLSDALVELRQEDLAFERDEAARLVRRLAGRDLTARHVDALMARTGGWAVGLQLAAVSLRQRPDVERFVETFADDDRHVADYLTEHVLRNQPEKTREFLLSTSVLDRMSGALCDFVTGGGGGQVMLDDLEHMSMFVTRLEGHGGWFRYHPLFRRLLRHHLRAEAPAREPLLLRRAAEWHLARDEVETAVLYLADAGAWSEVLDVAFAHGGASFAQGRAARVLRWIERVPRSHWEERPRVLLLRAAAAIVVGDPGTTGESLDAIDALPSASVAVRVVADLQRARSDLQLGAAEEALAAADRVLRDVDGLGDAHLPDLLGIVANRQDVSAAALHARGVALWHQGKAAARATLEGALQCRGHAVWDVLALGSLALLDAWYGRLRSAEQHGNQAIALARQVELDRQPVTIDAYLTLAHVARQRDDLDRAATFLEEAARWASPTRRPVAASLVGTEQALLTLAAAGPASGLAVLAPHRARGRPHPVLPPTVLARRRAVEARLSTMVGDLEGASRALDLAPDDTADVAAARVQLAVERGDIAAARGVIARWPADPEPHARSERLLWLAVLDHIGGDDTTACRRIAEVVAEAERERDVGVFRAAGHHVLGPLRLRYREAPTAFLRAIVDGLTATARRRPGPTKELVEQLTEREFAVLTLLPTRLSNDEIAARLDVSPNTLKTHLKHVYRKLGVAGRSAAVAAGEHLRLL